MKAAQFVWVLVDLLLLLAFGPFHVDLQKKNCYKILNFP